MPDKAQLFAQSVKRHFGIESDRFDSNHFHEFNKFIEDNHRYFYYPEDPDHYRFDVGNEHELVEGVEAQTLTKLFKFLKRGKAPGPNTIHNEVLRLGTTTSLFHHLAKLFTSSIQLGYIPTAWKIATLHMLLKSNKLPTHTTSYRPISLISSIMKLFEKVIEQRLRSLDEAEMLSSRLLRSRVPTAASSLKPHVVPPLQKNLQLRQAKQKFYHNKKSGKELTSLQSDDPVRFINPKGKWEFAKVKEEWNTARSYVVETPDRRSFCRNRRHMFLTKEQVPSANDTVSPSVIPSSCESSDFPTTRETPRENVAPLAPVLFRLVVGEL